MKKILIILLLAVFLITGCDIYKINYSSVSEMIDTILYKETKLTNINFEGYSFYLPRGTKIVDKRDYNLKIKGDNYYYYLYVDTIAYHYKTHNQFNIDKNSFYNEELKNHDLFGYVDIKEVGDKYFVVIMYNYAKIEGYVPKDDLNLAFAYMCSILSSIEFNDKVIATYIDNDKIISQEESFDIFSSKNENDNFLTYEQEYGVYEENNNGQKDEDRIELQED